MSADLPPLPSTVYGLIYEAPPDADSDGYTEFVDAPGYTATEMRAYALAARRAALEEAAQALDAQHEARKQHDNHAAVYARMVRELL